MLPSVTQSSNYYYTSAVVKKGLKISGRPTKHNTKKEGMCFFSFLV